MRWLALFALLLVPFSAHAKRRPEVLVYSWDVAATANGPKIAQALVPALTAHGMNVTQIQSGSNIPLIAFSQGLASGSGTSHKWDFGKTFDALVICGYDWAFPVDVRFDSLTRVGKYPTIPVFAAGATNGFNLSSGVCSLGVVSGDFQDTGANPTVSVVGANITFDNGSGLTNPTSTITSAASHVTKLITSAGNGDSTVAWKRAVGAGITVCSAGTNSANTAAQSGYAAMLIAMNSWIQDFPDSIRPSPQFKIALHIDDGFKRNPTGGGSIPPDQQATARAFADSIRARRVKYTVGVECHTDTLDFVDANGNTRFTNDMLVWDSQFAKFTPHIHGGVDANSRKANAGSAGTSLYDIFGGERNRECDPNSASDSSLYNLSLGALAVMDKWFGASKVDRCIMAPTDDYSPLNINSALCSQSQMLSSYRRAGFRAVRISGGAGNSIHLTNPGLDPSGYHPSAGAYPTDYGDIKLLQLNHRGYLPALNTTTALSATDRPTFLKDTLAGFFVGQPGSNTTQIGNGQSFLIVQHVANYTGAGPGWMVVRDVDNVMQAINGIWGREVWKWAWSEELAPGLPR